MQVLLLQGRCTDIWSSDLPSGRRLRPETGPVPEAVLLRPVTEAVSFCSPHSHLHRLVSEGSGNQDGSPRCSGKALLGRADTFPLAGKVPGCLEPKRGLSQKLSSRDLGGVRRLCAQVTKCWRRLEGTCDPGQAGFPASLMLSQVPRDWIGTEVVFHSPVV